MSKIGRNDPCPCGSGKKYKKCCVNKPLGPRKVTLQTSGNDNVQRMGKTASLLTGAFSMAQQPAEAKSLGSRVSSGGKDISAADILKNDEDQNSES